MSNKRGLLIIISGPSGVGKGTICAHLIERNSDMRFSVSATTRKIRAGEKEGINYFFKSTQDFEQMIECGEFLEYMRVFGENYYGTPRRYVEDMLKAGFDVILDIDVQGAMQAKANMPEATAIFVAPPSMDVLRGRLIGRGTETDEAIGIRLSESRKELSYIPMYDYIVVNDSIDETVKTIEAIIIAAKHTPMHYVELKDSLINDKD